MGALDQLHIRGRSIGKFELNEQRVLSHRSYIPMRYTPCTFALILNNFLIDCAHWGVEIGNWKSQIAKEHEKEVELG